VQVVRIARELGVVKLGTVAIRWDQGGGIGEQAQSDELRSDAARRAASAGQRSRSSLPEPRKWIAEEDAVMAQRILGRDSERVAAPRARLKKIR